MIRVVIEEMPGCDMSENLGLFLQISGVVVVTERSWGNRKAHAAREGFLEKGNLALVIEGQISTS